MSENFYEGKLYPLQDKVLQIIGSLETNFYLTGGTALSRCYINHRYSEDLDFFVNDSVTFREEINNIQTELNRNFDIEIQRTSERFHRISLSSGELTLKLKFINDVPFHFGELRTSTIFNPIDNPMNILSNKITAVMDRDETKDFADIFAIAGYMKKIDWRAIFVSAASKSAGIFAPTVAERLANFEFERLNQMKWYKNFKWEDLKIQQPEVVKSIISIT